MCMVLNIVNKCMVLNDSYTSDIDEVLIYLQKFQNFVMLVCMRVYL